MSTTTSSGTTDTSAAAATTTSGLAGSGQSSQGISLVAFIAALSVSLIIFGVQIFAFLILKNKLARIFKPKTYLVPERERTEPPPRSPWGWLFAIFRIRDREIIKKCGLDAYFFLRYLQTLLLIFIPLAIVILPILIPINKIGGRGSAYALEFHNSTTGGFDGATTANVTGLDVLAWGNVRPNKTNRYWAHLILALVVIIWVCGIFFSELRIYIRIRQDHLTSAEHRLRASATTVLVSSIPRKWLTTEALMGLYDVFPGGIRNVWINRNFDELLEKIKERDKVFKKLEAAETTLIRDAKKAQRKQLEKDEKAAMKGTKKTKEQKAQQVKDENAQAERLTQAGGMSTGDEDQVPHTVDDAIEEERKRASQQDLNEHKGTRKMPAFSAVGQGFGALGQGIGQGIGKGFNSVGKAGDTVIGVGRNLGRNIDNQLETTNGFMTFEADSPQDADYDQYGRFKGSRSSPLVGTGGPYGAGSDDNAEKRRMEEDDQAALRTSSRTNDSPENPRKLPGNAVRRPTYQYGGDGAQDIPPSHGWWKFWRVPAGGFATPVPHGYEEGDEFPLTEGSDPISKHDGASEKKKKKGFFAKIFHKGSPVPVEYPIAYNVDYKEDAHGAVWERYLKQKDRPTHRLPRFSWTPDFLPGLPLISPKVDTIYWCREELARLNLEIETDQKYPERFPLMNSAFIQFNHQVAAHMAAQSVTHHVPKHMEPRTVEISPKDVIWENMSIKWWEGWFRTALVLGIVSGMVILWAFPVAWTATLTQITGLAAKYRWLNWLNRIPTKVLQAIAGVLPALVLGILLLLVPLILKFLAGVQGTQTGTEREGAVQNYYFAFLFVQVFFIVSVSGAALASLANTTNIASIPTILAENIPKASNYFFSYMILQALSTSSGSLLQTATLLLWYILPKVFDNTARQKWTRNTTLPSVTWGTYFPVYTNFACIALIYSIVAPIISIFAIITFALLWIANRYNMLYVSRFTLDTGGLLYPRAINQTFLGLYVMEVCMVGLFFLVRDEFGNSTCIPQAIIMIISIVLTAVYQILLNLSFGPLFRYLPITFEDEAVLRDEAFERAQARRLGLDEEDEEAGLPQTDGAIEMSQINPGKFAKFKPANAVKEAGSWAARSGRRFKSATFNRGNDGTTEGSPLPAHRQKRHRDVEAQKRIADALYGGYNDEIEDLTPEERDVLVRHAFQHYALRARRPTIWIPRDDIGVSDDEVKRTREFAGKNIWISNVGAALDGKSRVVYGRNPPDFSEVDLINL